MSDTPMTDAYIGEGNDDNMTEGEIAMCEFARQLERHRNELLDALELALEVIEATGPGSYPEAESQIRKAIAKAKQRQP